MNNRDNSGLVIVDQVVERHFPRSWTKQNYSSCSDPDYDQFCWLAKEAPPVLSGLVDNYLQGQMNIFHALPIKPHYFRIYLGVTRKNT